VDSRITEARSGVRLDLARKSRSSSSRSAMTTTDRDHGTQRTTAHFSTYGEYIYRLLN
jgi:hypothetical protein